jgi:hypothetical protein
MGDLFFYVYSHNRCGYYITNNGGFASTTVAVRGWFRHLIPQGLRPVIVTPIVGEFCEWAAGLGVPSYAVPLPFPDKRWPVPFLRSLWKICRIARRHQIELIHANEHLSGKSCSVQRRG